MCLKGEFIRLIEILQPHALFDTIIPIDIRKDLANPIALVSIRYLVKHIPVIANLAA